MYTPIGGVVDDLLAAARGAITTVAHDAVPRRGKAVPLAQVANMEQALDYASAGYHTSVDNLLKAANSAVKGAWGKAAAGYFTAFSTAMGQDDLSAVKSQLAAANISADAAFRAQGTPASKKPLPPGAPPSAVAEPALAEASLFDFNNPTTLLAAGAALVAFLYLRKSGGKKRRYRKNPASTGHCGICGAKYGSKCGVCGRHFKGPSITHWHSGPRYTEICKKCKRSAKREGLTWNEL